MYAPARRAATVTAISALTLLAACAGGESDASGSGEPVQGGTLRVAYDGDPNCVDGQQAGNNTALNISRQLTVSLTDQDPETGEIVPWAAEDFSVNEDSSEFTFTLQEGKTFQDGSPLDSAAVKENFEQIQELGALSSLGVSYLDGLEAVETPDDRTVVLRFSQPSAQFLQASSTMTLGLYAPATYEASPEERCAGEIIGSGPFTLEEYTVNQGVTLRNDPEFDIPSSLAGHEGPAYLDEIDIEITPEASVRNGSLLSGQIDVDTVVQEQDIATLEARDLPIVSRANPGVVFSFFPRSTKPLGGDEAVRQAVNKALDREEFAAVLSDYAKPATSLLAESTPEYEDQSDLLAHDPDEAIRILEEAGWAEGDDGIREKDGERLSIELAYWQNAPVLELAQQQLRSVGVELTLDKRTIAEVEEVRPDLEFEFYNLTRADGDVLRTVFAYDGRNQADREEPAEFDEWLDRQAASTDPAERKELVNRAAAAIVEEGWAIPLFELSQVIGTSEKVHDFGLDASSRYQLYDTWVDE